MDTHVVMETLGFLRTGEMASEGHPTLGEERNRPVVCLWFCTGFPLIGC